MNNRFLKSIALFLVVNLLFQLSFPTIAYALTGGPSQPEMESFEPVGTTDMVDLFTGDFNYNIPLIDVGGYPINMAYHSGISMDQEASWVGLGWNINAGVINRTLRGLPDDFNGDVIRHETNIRDNITWGLNGGVGIEILGFQKKKGADGENAKDANGKETGELDTTLKTEFSANLDFGVTHNNYRGLGYFFGASFSIPSDSKFKGKGLGMGFNASSQGGFEYDVSFSRRLINNKDYKIGIGINSRSGLKGLVVGKANGTYRLNEGKTAVTVTRGFNRTLSLNPVCELPTLRNSFASNIQNYNVSYGLSQFGLHPNYKMGGTYSITRILDKIQENPGFGNMYAGYANKVPNALKDFTREKDGSFSTSSKFLPLSASAYDIISVSGQGTGGSFRSKRNNLLICSDPMQTQTGSNLASVGVELGTLTTPATQSLHVGVNWTPTYSWDKSGVWETGNNLLDTVFFYEQNNRFSELSYFKAGGEMLPMDIGFYGSMGSDEAVMLEIQGMGLGYMAVANSTLRTSSRSGGQIGNLSGYKSAFKRQPRTQLISTITSAEARNNFGWMPSLKSYYPGIFSTATNAYANINRTSTQAKDHHLGEITQTNPDGTRYIYGIPAYNNEQHEVSFNTGGNAIDYYKGLVEYSGSDNSLGNQKGQDWYYNRVITPGYAHSFLLTAILSPNYVDADKDGKPSIGDIGDYVVFNYTRHAEAYKWRAPIEGGKAQFQEGLKSDPMDDKGNYVYGTKEIWYLHSIETRTHVAEFKLSPRLDALGALGENGGKDDAQVLMKLDTISLYARPDRLLNGVNATPIKKVVFEYDYSLCKNVANNKNYNTSAAANQKGKLTLKKVYFIHGKSGKGSMSPYRFTYGFNPDYNMAEYDRWGNYKPNKTDLPNRDYPYVQQNNPRDSADRYAAAWHMERIDLPSGGSIQVKYEADDYAFVQDRKAMEMIQVIAATDESCKKKFDPNGRTDKLFENKGNKRFDYLVFRLPQGINTDQLLRDKCFSLIEHLFFKFLIDIKGKKEYISGWCTIDKNEVGVVPGDPPQYGYVKINFVKQGDWLFNKHEPVNAISKTAWDFARANMSKVLHPGSDPKGTGVSAFKGLLSSFGEALDMYRGQNQALKVKEIASEFVPYKSWIRIESPHMFKRGGGTRVKELTFSDSWASMDTEDATGNYSQVYDYTKEDDYMKQYGYDKISSGVASYEPMIGGEENPMRLPIKYLRKGGNIALPAVEMVNEEPFGETFYPAPLVGYSKITVKKKPKAGINRTGVGHSEYEFYTARDFPVRVEVTNLHKQSLGSGRAGALVSSLLKFVNLSYYAATQGYSVIVNDMHGKPKATAIYSQLDEFTEQKALISKVSYEYQTQNGKLDNQVQVLNSKGMVENAIIGKEIDMSVDMKENVHKEVHGGLQVNAKFDLIAPIAATVWGIPLITFKYTMNRMQAASVTKVIQEYGILKSTTVQDEGSIIKTSNLLYDKVSGQVLLTQTSNSFNDPIYNLNYPAHMAYAGMGPAYLNAGVSDTLRFLNSSGVTKVVKDLLFKGDELMLIDVNASTNAYKKAWVLSTASLNDTMINATLIDKNGQYITAGTYYGKVLTSGRKNMITGSVGAINSTTNPISGDSIRISSTGIINASAATFKDNWPALYVPKEGNGATWKCDYGTEPYIVETFKALLSMVERKRNNEPNINPYLLQNESWFNASSAINQKLKALGDTLDLSYLYIGINAPDYAEDWANTNSFSPYITWNNGEEDPYNTIHMLITAPTGCLFSNVDTFIYFGRNPNNANSYSTGMAKAIMLNGDTCAFTFYAAYNGGDIAVANGVNCRYLFTCNYGLPYGLFNPFLSGHLSQWRSFENLAFIDGRAYNYQGDTTFIRKDGAYKNFVPYWSFNSSGWLQKSTNKRWVKSSTVTQYNKTGKPVEAVDALNNATAELYGYDENYVVATASNAQLKEIANDNFEDYTGVEQRCDQEDHWRFKYSYVNRFDSIRNLGVSDTQNPDTFNTEPFISGRFAHSGTQSIGIPTGTQVSTSSMVDSGAVYIGNDLANGYQDKTVANRLPRFNPQKGKTYHLEAWVRGRTSNMNAIQSYDSCAIRVSTTTNAESFYNTLLNVQFKPTGPIIEGWQRIEGNFTIPAGSDLIQVTLENKSTHRMYVDDIRIHPLESNMKTFVYHPVLLKVMAVLDENNFATFYEYDQEGKLIRIKKETVKGIMTIQESRSGINKPINQ